VFGYSGEEIDGAQLKRILKKTHEELDSYERQLEQMNLAINKSAMVRAKKILELCKNSELLLKSASAQEVAECLKMVCWNPVLDGSTIRFSLQKPFSLIAKMRENASWWAHLDLNQGPWSYEHPALTS
jgi:hypothetical protein